MKTERICRKCFRPLGEADEETICEACQHPTDAFHLRSHGRAGSGNGHGPRFTPPAPAELGAEFPDLEILSLIGHGGMGAVYRARQKTLDRIVALKILPPEIAGEAMVTERFVREARALARLNHPNIVGVYDFGRAGRFFYLVMEFVDGPSLRQLLSGGRLAPERALQIVPQICEALQYAHGQGVVHRDIKPENILLDRAGRVRIADFGLARLAGPSGRETLTLPDQVMGTPQYMAPEQIERPLAVDHRADIYSLGVVFYEMLTGELPLGRFEPPSQRARVDARLDDVVLRSLRKNPDERYQRASEFKSRVATIGGDQAAAAEPAAMFAKGFEYRSAMGWRGWPLLHVAFGFDAAGRKRIARGVVAVGEIARGGIAVGGIATGLVAIGGLSFGLLGIGGIALGLVACGGIGLGLAAAFAGVAAAPVASGMVALGIWSRGALALGLHTVTAQGADQVAVSVFKSLEALSALRVLARGLPGLTIVLSFAFPLAFLLLRRFFETTDPRTGFGRPPKAER